MSRADDGIATLRAEIASYYAGIGDPAALRHAFREAAVLVPLTDDGRLLTTTYRGVAWMCVFTGTEEYARYATARTEPEYARKRRYHTVFGSRIVDHAARIERPTGIVVDLVGPAPMAFPPRIDSIAGVSAQAGTE